VVRAGDVTVGAGALFVVGAAILYLARPTVGERRTDNQAIVTGALVPGGWIAAVRGSL